MNNKEYKFNPIAWSQQGSDQEVEIDKSVSSPSSSASRSSNLEEEVSNIAQEIVNRGIDITQGYRNWLHLGFALAEGLGENGRGLFHNLSSMSEQYNPSECDKQYTACLYSSNGGITIKTFFQMAKEANIDIREFSSKKDDSNRVCANSAIVPSANSANKEIKSTNLAVLDKGLSHVTLAQLAQTTRIVNKAYNFSSKLYIEDLDFLTRKIIELHGDDASKCDAQILGMLNAVGGLLGGVNGKPESRSGIYGLYDGRRVYAPVYNIVFSRAGNGKGMLSFCRHLLYPVKREMKRKYEEEKAEYDKAMAAWEIQNKKDRGQTPVEPVRQDPFMPGNSSASAVYRQMEANGGWGMIFETEADTVSAIIGTDYGNYSDLMRKAHHHEAISMSRVTEKIHIDIEEPRLGIFLTCTPGQLPALFPSFENGLGSRFLFYELPDEDVNFRNVFAMSATPLEDTYKQLGEEIMPLYHCLQSRVGRPIQFMLSDSQQKEFLDTYRETLREQFSMLGPGINAFVFRIALECFRYAMILTALRRLDQWKKQVDYTNPDIKPIFSDNEIGIVCDDRDFRTAMTIVDCLIFHSARVYATLAKEDDNPFDKKDITLSKEQKDIFDTLPEGECRTKDFIEICEKYGISERTAKRILKDFCYTYRILVRIKHGVYRKLIRKEE